MNNLVLKLEIGGRVYRTPLKVGGEVNSVSDGVYTLESLDEDLDDYSIEVYRQGDHLVISINGQEMLTIEGYFLTSPAASFIVDGMPSSAVIGEDSTEEGLLWSSSVKTSGFGGQDWAAVGLFAAAVGYAASESGDDRSDSGIVPPTEPAVELPTPAVGLSLDSGSDVDLVSNDPTLALSNLVDGAEVRYSLDNGATYSDWYSGVAELNTALVSDEGLTQGQTTIDIQQRNANGVVSEAGRLEFILDSVAPAISIDDPLEGDNIINASEAASVVVSGRSDEPGGTVVLRLFASDDEELASFSVPVLDTGVWQTPDIDLELFNLPDGEYTVVAEITDVAGNTATAARALALDTTAAQLAVSLNADTGVSASDQVTSDPTLSIVGIEEGARLRFTLDAGANYSDWFDSVGALNTALASAVVDGELAVGVQQIDPAGNVSALVSESFTLDRTAQSPVVLLANGNNGRTADPSLSITNFEPGAQLQYSLDGVNYSDWFADLDALNTAVLAESTFNTLGDKTVFVRQQDQAGNISVPGSVTFELVESDVKVVVFDLVHGTSSTVDSSRVFESDVEYFIYIVVDEDSPDVALDANQQWRGASALDEDDRIVLLSDTGQPIGLDGSKVLDAYQITGAREAALWTTFDSGSTGAQLNATGLFQRTYSSVQNSVNLWSTSIATFDSNGPGLGLSEHWVDAQSSGSSLVVTERGINPDGDIPDRGAWNVQFSVDQNSWVDTYGELSVVLGQGEQTIYVRMIDAVTFEATPVLSYVVNTNEPPAHDVIVFDLVNGYSSTGSDGDRIFDENTVYTIYIVVDENAQPGETQLVPDNDWTGGTNLGEDDTIILIADGGGPIAGEGSVPGVQDVQFAEGNNPRYVWQLPGTGNTAAVLKTDGVFSRYTTGGSRTTVNLFDNLPETQSAGNPIADYSNGFANNVITIERDAYDNQRYDEAVFEFFEKGPIDDPDVQFEYATQLDGSGEPTDWQPASELFNLLDPDGAGVNTAYDFIGDLYVRMVHPNEAPGADNHYIRIEDLQVLEPGQDPVDREHIVVFDLVGGTSDTDDVGGTARTFDANDTYTIFIVVEHNSGSVNFDNNMYGWSGVGDLSSDDKIILVSKTGDGILGNYLGQRSGGSFSATAYYFNSTNTTNGSTLNWAAQLQTDGDFVRRYSNSANSADLWDGQLAPNVNVIYSSARTEYANYLAATGP